MKEWIGPVVVTIIVLGCIALITNSCSNSRIAHYNLAQECINSGGSWVDMTSDETYKGTCINNNKGVK